ncbi:MAG TPA: efflux RND transporter periplasmic adaptor subunit [candidate division Zixibacteria bacterium]|nr:efflux RND transporter periplasmic adaptor subunit [candidate division Zixibacteria bacterium]
MRLKSGLLAALCALVVFGCGGAEQPAGEADAHAGHAHGPGGHAEAAPIEPPAAQADDWCAEHRVPESQCTACDPALIAAFIAAGDWCEEHGLPESHCRLCNPGLGFPQEEPASSAADIAAEEIRVSLFFRPNALVCATNDALIQLATARTAERAGLTVQQVRAAELETTIEAPAEVVFDETRTTAVATTVAALVARWVAAPGETVREDQVLAILQSPEVAALESQLLSAHADLLVHTNELARQEELRGRDLISDAELERQRALFAQAKAAYVAGRGLLRAAGLSEDDLDEIIAEGRISSTFALRAPTAGLLVERRALPGELQEAGSALARLADPAVMWIEARLTEEQLRQVAVGEPLTFASDGRGLSRVGGKIIWVARFLDPHSRTGTVRAQVVDHRHTLQAGEFGRVTIARTGHRRVALVPRDAVQWEGCCNVVFVREAADRYRPRKVEFTDGAGPYYQVLRGLEPGEEVVVDGAFLLKTELKKASIGAGCCGLDPVG